MANSTHPMSLVEPRPICGIDIAHDPRVREIERICFGKGASQRQRRWTRGTEWAIESNIGCPATLGREHEQQAQHRRGGAAADDHLNPLHVWLFVACIP